MSGRARRASGRSLGKSANEAVLNGKNRIIFVMYRKNVYKQSQVFSIFQKKLALF